VISNEGIVLLLGRPASGKTMIAAILATAAIEEIGHRCFKVLSPQELIDKWNPNESGGFYWIDDAFGPNQLRSDYVDEWISNMSKVKAAIAMGNRFVLTSRTHIWNAAKPKLGTRCLQALSDGSAIVHVGTLGQEERSQILYNHIKSGSQSKSWREGVKPYLEDLSNDVSLLPEMARRLGDVKYTTGINQYPADLLRFVEAPMDFLKETIGELEKSQQAALVLVFLSESCLASDLEQSSHTCIVCEKYDVSATEIGDALRLLDESFVVKKTDSIGESWSFVHPTLTDAMASLLGDRADLADLYLAGANIRSILSDTNCTGQPHIPDSILIPDRSVDLLVTRLSEVEDEPSLNRQLFSYLNDRASEIVVREFVEKNNEIFLRKVPHSWRINFNESIRFCAKCDRYGLLPENIGTKVCERLEYALLQEMDAGFLDDDDLLRLIPPTKLLAAVCKLMDYVRHDLSSKVEELEDEASEEEDGYGVFEETNSFVSSIEYALNSYAFSEDIEAAKELIATASSRVDDRHVEVTEEWDGEDVTPVKLSEQSFSRSIFSDVDE